MSKEGIVDAPSLASAMGCSLAIAERYITHFNKALVAANCTNVNRAAMFCAQLGHESAGLRYMEEIASGQAYEGRKDLGNVNPGDGKRFKGRGPIQLTGRHNYGLFGKWCKQEGYVSSSDYFTQNPTKVATGEWGFLAASWYWVVARPALNSYSDKKDILAATKAINGGTNGLADRQRRWNNCLGLGKRLLPTNVPTSSLLGDPVLDRPLAKGNNSGTIVCPVGSASGVVAEAWISVRCDGGGRIQAWFQKSAKTDTAAPGAGKPIDYSFKNAERSWAPIPSGTEYIQYSVDANGAGGLAVELKGK